MFPSHGCVLLFLCLRARSLSAWQQREKKKGGAFGSGPLASHLSPSQSLPLLCSVVMEMRVGLGHWVGHWVDH